MKQTTQTGSTAARSKKAQRKKKSMAAAILSWVGTLALALIVALLVRTFLCTFIVVKGNSMQDTLQSGDRLYISLLTAHLEGYERGDVVICRYPGRRDLCIKRIIALPGETVSAQGGVIYIDGAPLEEDYVSALHAAHYSYPETTLSDGEYFLLGDNRAVSHDSHSADVGPVTDIVGKARAIIWPPSHGSLL